MPGAELFEKFEGPGLVFCCSPVRNLVQEIRHLGKCRNDDDRFLVKLSLNDGDGSGNGFAICHGSTAEFHY